MFIAEGSSDSSPYVADIMANGWGRMWVVLPPKPLPGEPWAFDNGAFRDYTAGKSFNLAAFRRRLRRAQECTSTVPELAVVPDIVAGGLDSLTFSLSWLGELPSEWPWYLAVQDGMTPEDVAPVLDKFAGIFLGGTNLFKKTAPQWVRLAHSFGKKFHYGRAGTLRKLHEAYLIQADSLDSALPLWTKKNWREFNAAWKALHEGSLGTPIPLLNYL